MSIIRLQFACVYKSFHLDCLPVVTGYLVCLSIQMKPSVSNILRLRHLHETDINLTAPLNYTFMASKQSHSAVENHWCYGWWGVCKSRRSELARPTRRLHLLREISLKVATHTHQCFSEGSFSHLRQTRVIDSPLFQMGDPFAVRQYVEPFF